MNDEWATNTMREGASRCQGTIMQKPDLPAKALQNAPPCSPQDYPE